VRADPKKQSDGGIRDLLRQPNTGAHEVRAALKPNAQFFQNLLQ
jgi:hypothetical protein